MEQYKNRSGKSGVHSFEIDDNWIIVRFVDGGIYLYDQDKPGANHVTNMKRLARAGKGLATYINQYVRDNYATKLA